MINTLKKIIIGNPRIDIDSIQFPLSLDACLREAASAKAGERAACLPVGRG